MATNTSTLTLHREMPVGPDKLWTLLTDPAMRELWGNPDEKGTMKVEIADLKVGGFERHKCGPESAEPFTVETRWYQLDGPEAACFTETLIIEGFRIFTSLVTYALEAKGSGTALDIHVSTTSFSGEDVGADVKEGWEGGLASLDRLVARQTAAA